MTHQLRIPHNGFVIVADGHKALLLRNEGDPLHPDLRTVQVLQASDNPSTHVQGTDRPGRVAMGGRRSAVEQADWHERAEQDFATEVAEALGAVCGRTQPPGLVVVAPPRTLAHLRSSLPDPVKRLLIAEIDQDLTKLPVSEIEDHLTR